MKTFFFFDFDEDDIITNLQMQHQGMMYSLSLPGKKQNFPGPGTMRAVMAPVLRSNSRSTGQPRLRQVQVLMTSFCLSSHNRMNLPLFIKDMQNLSEIYRCIS